FAGRTIRFRVGETNNGGKLLVGVDNVHLVSTFVDTAAPAINNLRLRNPNFQRTPDGLEQTSDPSFAGQVTDNGTPNNVQAVIFDVNNGGFGGPDDIQVNQFDPSGQFTFTPQTTFNPGPHTIKVRVVDHAGNFTDQTLTFVVQGPSLSTWVEQGP